MSEYAENAITKLDVVRVEHDLVCGVLDRLKIMMDNHVAVNADAVLAYIDGLRAMAAELMRINRDDD